MKLRSLFVTWGHLPERQSRYGELFLCMPDDKLKHFFTLAILLYIGDKWLDGFI